MSVQKSRCAYLISNPRGGSEAAWEKNKEDVMKIEVEKQLLEEALDALLGYQEKIEGEFGMGRSNEQIERDGDTDPVIVKLRDALKA